ncbi:hypothetical protein D0Z08_18005 [Nocardioides immobilis]|uniref:DUF4393 domain-containing protein n=1 Tax=Nocardioides immobilis TaxID=2049295 RepID=A0A417XZ80_9ACTN|nr:hypothetical protein [Nocardioides immobilis]RHW25671.1 hypothetical protein D0Z08_18005 [Nocardioides immobilis]
MTAVDDLRPLVGTSVALLRATARLAEGGGRRLLGVPASGTAVTLVRRESNLAPALERLGTLLERGALQSSGDAESALFEDLVGRLVPDEARIIAALGSRGWSPLVHIEPRRPDDVHLGLRNASLIGRQGGVTLVRRTPLYVTRLVAAGLLAVTPARDDHPEDYEILLADPDVLDAIRAASRGPLGARVHRQGLALSDLGAQLWAAHRAETGE